MKQKLPAALCTAIAGLSLAAASAPASASASALVQRHSSGASGTATYAEQPGATPNYIFPMLTGAYYSVANIEQFERLSFRSLYWIGNDGKPVLDPSLSLAYPPTFSAGNTVVDIKLRNYNWSDGTPVSARDVALWINLLEANKTSFAAYVPGEFPDNLKSYKVTGPKSIQLTLTGPVNPTWFTYDQLSQITPLPQQAWDRTSATGAIGNYDETTAGAVKVFDFLTAQSKDIATYGSNPLWQTVDGPWKLKQYQSDGYVEFKANPSYSGPVKPKLEYFVEEPFTTDTAELDVLRSGSSIDYGYLPAEDAAQASAVNSGGYKTSVWNSWGIDFFVFNFDNPKTGPIVAQPYVRQAMQSLVDQSAYIKGPLHGYGHTDYGPVPTEPSTFATSYEEKGPWRYDPATAMRLLKSHGWDVKPGGTTACARPGTGPSECGAGITKGEQLAFNLAYASGNVVTSEEMQALKSNWSAAGITVNLSTAPFDTIIADAAPCKSSQSSCSWQMANWGGGWTFGVDPYPTGDQLFASGSGSNFSNYDSPTANKLIGATVHGSASLSAYENYLANQVPVIWMPQAAYQISEISTKLHGALPQSPIESLTPEDWTLSK
ncbi:MAG: ABC transporter substrate-binding protein [Actinomycetota bacterium]|nr:ABC transporter substrate-binding protein [Actinomycetota bacterium]